MFQELFPIITTSDMERALGFYRDLLGFEVEYQFPERGDPEYVGLRLASSQLGVAARDPAEAEAQAGDGGFALWVYADDCDAAIEELRRHGVSVIEEPVDQPWGERIATVTDPDGNRVIVGQRAAAT
jgi:lactoylglutathione lyase